MKITIIIIVIIIIVINDNILVVVVINRTNVLSLYCDSGIHHTSAFLFTALTESNSRKGMYMEDFEADEFSVN